MTGHEASDGGHGPHLGKPEGPAGGTPQSSRRTRISWRVAYVAGLAVVAASLFLLVPNGGSVALLVLLGGLMALHHLPGGHGHNH